jgi:hypothetical protein
MFESKPESLAISVELELSSVLASQPHRPSGGKPAIKKLFKKRPAEPFA